MGSYGSQNFKTLLLPQITFESFQPFPGFSSPWSSQKYCFRFLKVWVFHFNEFLALLDYISRAHEIAICLSSVVRPSVSPGRVAIISELNARISFSFSYGFPWAIPSDIFWIFEKRNSIFLRIFFVFVNMGPYGGKNFKTILLLQIAADSFQTFPEFSSQWSSQNTLGIFWNFENWKFNEFYSFSLTWDAMGAKITKRFSSYKSETNVLKLVLNFSPNGPHKTTFGVFEIFFFWVSDFYRFFFSKIANSPL